MFTLAVVTFGALIAHTLAACLFTIDIGWTVWGRSLHIVFPDVYGAAMALSGDHPPTGGRSAAFAGFLLTCAGLSALAFLATFAVMRCSDTAANAFRRAAYGWLAQLVEEGSRPDRAIAAFVLTNLSKDGAYVGYEGLVENLSLASDKQIAVIQLSDCNVFLLRIGRSVHRERISRDEPIPLITLEGSNIANVAFTVVQFA